MRENHLHAKLECASLDFFAELQAIRQLISLNLKINLCLTDVNPIAC